MKIAFDEITTDDIQDYIQNNHLGFNQELYNYLKTYEKNENLYVRLSGFFSGFNTGSFVNLSLTLKNPNKDFNGGDFKHYCFSLINQKSYEILVNEKTQSPLYLTQDLLKNFGNLESSKNLDPNFLNSNVFLKKVTIDDFVKMFYFMHENHKENTNFGYLMTFSNNCFVDSLNSLIDNATLPKKFPGEYVNVAQLTSNVYSENFPTLNFFSRVKIFQQNIKFTPTEKNNTYHTALLEVIDNINLILAKEISNPSNSVEFEKDLFNFCKKHRSHLFNKDLSQNNTMNQFYKLLSDVSKNNPSLKSKIDSFNTFYNERKRGVSLEKIQDKCLAEQAGFEVFHINFNHFKENTSTAFFNKFRNQIEPILNVLFTIHNYEVLLPFKEKRNNDTSQALIRKTNGDASTISKIWEDLEVMMNYLNINSLELTESNFSTVLLQAQLESDSPIQPIKGKPANKF